MLRDIERLTRQRLNVAEHDFSAESESPGSSAMRDGILDAVNTKRMHPMASGPGVP